MSERVRPEQDFLRKVADGLRINVQVGRTDAPDILEWIAGLHLVTEQGHPFDYTGEHKFLAKIMRDFSKRKAIRKCAQVGMSTSLFVQESYMAKNFDWSIIHTMPTIALLRFFVAQKVDEVIKNNKEFRLMFGKGAQNTVQRKKIGRAWIMLLGTKGENEEISHTSDLNVHDEIDKSDMSVIDGMRSRSKHSRFKGRWEVSNPEADGYGVSAAFDASCQYHWHHRCSRCNHWFFNDFFSCIDFENETYICPGCRKPLREEDRAEGRWVARWQSRVDDGISGYWISHTMAPWISASEMVEDFFTLSEENFYTYDLGVAPPNQDARIDKEIILRSCTNETPDMTRGFMGVDPGGQIFCTIGIEQGITALEILDNSDDSGWDKLDILMDRYKIVTCVCDKLPYPKFASAFAERWPGKVWLQLQNKDDKSEDIIRFSQKGDSIVYLDKNELISYALKQMQVGRIKIFMDPHNPLLSGRITGRMQKDYNSFIGQASTLQKFKEEDPSGNVRFRWKASPKRDHFWMAYCYLLAALDRNEKVKEKYKPEKIKEDPPLTGSPEWFKQGAPDGDFDWIYA